MSASVAGSGLHRLIGSPSRRPASAPAGPAGRPTGDPADPVRRPDGSPPPRADDESPRCELCAGPIPPDHRHLADLPERALRCACQACALLFDRDGAGRYRLVPRRRRWLPDFRLDDRTWDDLRIPVGVAFFFPDSAAGRTVAFYPSPAGAVESLLDLATWSRVEADNPVLGELTSDVEALLVNRARGAREHWLVPIDDCYTLVALIRTGWRGLAGGARVWDEIGEFFADLRRKAHTTHGTKP